MNNNISNVENAATPKYMLTLILMIVPLTGMVIDIYTPSLPAMTRYFAVDKSLVQLTITVEVIAFGLFHTVFSTLSSTTGQRRLLIPGMVLLTIVSFLVPFSPNITVLLCLRFLQGVFISMPSAISKNLLTMHFDGELLRRYANYMTITWALGPIVAPAIGGYLQNYFDWQAPFLFLAAYSLFCLINLYFFLPKTEKPTETSKLPQLVATYGNLMIDRVFMGAVICLSLMYGLLITFNVIGPFVIQKVLGYSAVQFGYVAMLMGVAWLLGTVINRVFLVQRFAVVSILSVSMRVLVVLTAIMLIAAWWILNLGFVVLFSFMILCIGAINYPNLLGEVFSLYKHQANIANGLMGSLNLLGAGLVSLVAASLYAQSAMPLAGMFFGLIMVSAVIYHWFVRPKIR